MPVRTVIKNARMVNEGAVTEGDLAIRDGRIDQIGGVIDGERDIDADGAWLMPGMIDDQVHFREPGFEHKGDIATESRAALAGGITSYMEMPNCQPQTITATALEDKHRRAAAKSLANYAFYFGATNDNLEAIKAVDPARACGVKVFMGASTGNMLVDDEAALEGIFAASPLIIATHCEDTPTILANEARARAIHGDAIPFAMHPEIRSAEACHKSSSLAVELARRHGSHLHVLHLTTERELALFSPGDMAGKRITAEACVHHLFFDDGDYPALGADIKCNPAIKRRADREALRAAVADGRIDIIATDHAPHTRAEKDQPYPKAPAGLPLVQHALTTLFEHMPAERIAQKTAHAPAMRFGVRERGYLREGYWADLVLIDPEGRTVVDDEPLFSKCGWTPFAGHAFRARVTHTFVNGRLAYADGRVCADEMGMGLQFAR